MHVTVIELDACFMCEHGLSVVFVFHVFWNKNNGKFVRNTWFTLFFIAKNKVLRIQEYAFCISWKMDFFLYVDV